MDSNSTAPPLARDLLLHTQLELVTPTTVAGTLYGIAFTLFCLYVHALAPQLREGDRTTQARFMLTYSTVILLCGLYYLLTNAWVIQDAYIQHSDYPGGGPYSYVVSTFRTTSVIPIGLTCQMVVDLLTLVYQVWRVWVIWSTSRYRIFVTVLPVLGLLTFTGLRLRTIVLETTVLLGGTKQIEYAIQGATTILCTALISLRIFHIHWQLRRWAGKCQTPGYMSISAMVVESYAPQSIWFLITAIVYNQVVGPFFAESALYIEIITYFLLLYLAACDRALRGSQRERRNITSERWHRSHYQTQLGETSGIQDGSRVPAVPEAASISQVSGVA